MTYKNPAGLAQGLKGGAAQNNGAVRPRQQHPAFVFLREVRKSRKRSYFEERMQAGVPQIQKIQKFPAVNHPWIEIQGHRQGIRHASGRSQTAIPAPTAKMRRKSHKAPDIVEQSVPSLVHAGRVYQLRAHFCGPEAAPCRSSGSRIQ
jgi:hypothetical protein